MTDERLADLARTRLLDLTTFRRDGRSVMTPVRHAVDGGRIVVSLRADSGKVRRAVANPSVLAGTHAGTLRFLEGDDARAASAVLRRRHRGLFVRRLLAGRRPTQHRMAEIVLDS